ncbi:unnamed protein product [Discula destructiva]
MTARSSIQPSRRHIELIAGSNPGLKHHRSFDDFYARNKYQHLFTASASHGGVGDCNAWLIKPELVDLKHYAEVGIGPGDSDDLMHQVFDWPKARNSRDVDKGVKFLQQFDASYDYLEEELHDIREEAWILLFQNVRIPEQHRRLGHGTSLVRAVLTEVFGQAQRQGRTVLAFVRLDKALLQAEGWSPVCGLLSERRSKAILEAKIQAAFWKSLAFERVNDGHLFPKELDWLAWSPRARNAAILFDKRPRPFPNGFDALIEEDTDDCG